jgi:hypothetical protein
MMAGLASSYFGLRWPIVAGAAIVIAACIWVHRSREQIKRVIPEPAKTAATG